MLLPTRPAAEALLERHDELAAIGERIEGLRRTGHGRLVLVSGEAGIGKTALVSAVAAAQPALRILRGACDALHTPRPLGPFSDIADETGGTLRELVDRGAPPGAVLSELSAELRRVAPSLVLLEDLHWADDATLDVLRLLARRIAALPAIVLATYRDDEVDREHPLRAVLGDLPRSAADRIALAPLTGAAVAELAGGLATDPDGLHRRTGGNPFFVTEVLASADAGTPGTVRDAVIARIGRLDAHARELLDAVAIVPQRVELALLGELTEGELRGLDAALGSGVLLATRDTVAFRHEIARVAVEEMLPPHRRLELNRRALAALSRGTAPDAARLAHHAEAAGERSAVLRHAPEAGARAALLASHREAVAHYRGAVAAARELAAPELSGLLERYAYECYLTGQAAIAVDARREALEIHRSAGDTLREGDGHRWLSRLAWFEGDGERADEEARCAIALLEPLPESRELAMAWSNMAQLRMLAGDAPGATSWGLRAIELAERLGETEPLVHALANAGTIDLRDGMRERLERSLALALQAGLEEHAARAFTNLGSGSLAIRHLSSAAADLDAGIAYCEERDLGSWESYMLATRAACELLQGHWDAAATSASAVLRRRSVAAPSRIPSLVVVGSLRARRGDPDPWAPLDEALRLAYGTRELQRLGPVASARAEARWIAGEDDRVAAETDEAVELAIARNDPWLLGELLAIRQRAGLDDAAVTEPVAPPFRHELAGDPTGAAACWRELGAPYEAALALAGADDAEARRQGLDGLQALGATATVRRVTRELRGRGIRDIRQGPRARTRGNPAGLTARELEVLLLVADGLRNGEIAARLFLSERTVAHHVSAILRKLGARTRAQAGAEAVRLGLRER